LVTDKFGQPQFDRVDIVSHNGAQFDRVEFFVPEPILEDMVPSFVAAVVQLPSSLSFLPFWGSHGIDGHEFGRLECQSMRPDSIPDFWHCPFLADCALFAFECRQHRPHL
jgi:hypothetical protein